MHSFHVHIYFRAVFISTCLLIISNLSYLSVQLNGGWNKLTTAIAFSLYVQPTSAPTMYKCHVFAVEYILHVLHSKHMYIVGENQLVTAGAC